MAIEPGKLETLAVQLKELSEALAAEDPASLQGTRARRVHKTVSQAYDKLRKVMDDLDPVKHPGFVFDPSNPSVAGRVAGITMIAQARKPLLNDEKFYGAGVYAIYYSGDFPAYTEISKREHPIYVGKADPVVPNAKTAFEQGDRLASRIREHRKNISKAVTTLRPEDFEYRALVVQSGWQTPTEDYLIGLFKPIWNKQVGICYGFGKHGDAPETRANLRSPWDTLHPSRDWAHRDPKMKDAKPAKQIVEEIREHLKEHPPFGSVGEILRRFLKEMQAAT